MRAIDELGRQRLEAAAAALAIDSGESTVDTARRAAAATALTTAARASADRHARFIAAEQALAAYRDANRLAPGDADQIAAALAAIELLRMTLPEAELWKLAYAEAGQWARHFSTVRATVSTFLIGVSIGVVSFGWAQSSWDIFAAIAGGVWLLMLVLLAVFSRSMRIRWWHQQTAEDRLGMRAMFAAAGNPAGPPGRHKPGLAQSLDAPVWIVLLLTLGFAAAIAYRCLAPPPEHIDKVELVF